MIVSGYAEELMGSLPENDNRRADLQEIVKAGERMAGLTGQLNQLVRPPRFQRESLDLRAWMNALLPALSGLLPGVEIRAGVSAQQVTLETSPAVLNGILMDAAKILRPVLQPGMRVELNGAAATGDRAVIWWKVEGGEIPSAVKERFLEPFAGPKEGADPPLGVAGWLRPWQDLGGTLVLEADPAERFLLILTCPGRSCEPGETPPPPKGPRLLVVEDEESIRTLVVRALGREGYEVESMATAGDALQALERAAGEVRLLITDFNMPGMSGLELAEKARAQQPGLRVLLISGATESAQANEALRGRLPEGFAFLQKPFGPGVLVEHVRRMLV
jgi:CheY-like chemotaxis protein